MLLAYYCHTQKQFFRKFAKFIGKLLCRSPFLNKVGGGRLIKKRLHSENYFFHVFLQFFIRISEIIGTFRERFIFKIIGLVLLFMSGFYTMEPKHIDQSSNSTKQRLYLQNIHASVNITKVRKFLRSF